MGTKLEKLSDILPDLEAGKTNKEIGDKFGKSVQSINVYVRKLRESGIAIPARRRGRKPMPL